MEVETALVVVVVVFKNHFLYDGCVAANASARSHV